MRWADRITGCEADSLCIVDVMVESVKQGATVSLKLCNNPPEEDETETSPYVTASQPSPHCSSTSRYSTHLAGCTSSTLDTSITRSDQHDPLRGTLNPHYIIRHTAHPQPHNVIIHDVLTDRFERYVRRIYKGVEGIHLGAFQSPSSK